MPTSRDQTELPNIVIKSEEDAYAVLVLARDNKLPPFGQVIFDGWPTLSLYLQGEKFHQSITPTVMRGLLEFQRGIYQSYAAAKYDHPTKRLSDDERKALEIRVDVRDGSSDFGINFQELAVKLIEQLGGKMDPVHVLITVVSIAVLYFGSSAYKSFLEHRKDVRSKEVSDETQRKTLEALQFTSVQETERMKIMSDLAKRDHRVKNIGRLAYEAHSEVVKTLAAGDKAAIEGISIAPEVAESLTRNARRKSTEVRLDGIYRLVKLDWTDPLKFKVRVFNTDTGLQIDADVQDDSLTGKYKEALREAEWSRAPVALKINAKLVGEDDYRDAVVVAASGVQLPPTGV
jgi:hypothetical protein